MTTVVIEDERAAHYLAALGPAFPDVTFHCFPATEQMLSQLGDLGDAEVLMTTGHCMRPDVLAALPSIKWVQALITGLDHFLPVLAGRSGILLTSVRGIHGPQMAEAVVTQLLVLARDVMRSVRNQQSRTWERWDPPSLRGRTVGVVGLGVSGREVGRLCKALGMTVLGVSHSSTPAACFDAVRGYDELHEVASAVDYLVFTLPYNAESHHLVNKALLAAMRPTAYLLNISRGGIVDEDALVDALRRKVIAGAALDVFQSEPLPEDSPIWGLENVFCTAHLGGRYDRYAEQALTVVEPNLRHYLAGEPEKMVNRIDLRSAR